MKKTLFLLLVLLVILGCSSTRHLHKKSDLNYYNVVWETFPTKHERIINRKRIHNLDSVTSFTTKVIYSTGGMCYFYIEPKYKIK